ncbi:hypothetical protein [Brevundimonas sp.]|uniref:hypothetical protein n=1 Tax=Brevundimonas sp. TaxID=1871086 RepID=UPI003D14696A
MAGPSDELEVARFATLPEGELAVSFLRQHGIDARLPDRDTATMNPDLLFALGGVRVVARDTQIAEARRLIARMRSGEFAGDDAETGEWMADATPGRIGELEDAEITGVMSHAKKAGAFIVVLFFVVFPLAGCLLMMLG